MRDWPRVEAAAVVAAAVGGAAAAGTQDAAMDWKRWTAAASKVSRRD